MERSRSLLDRAAIIPIAACALLFGSTLSVVAQSPAASTAAGDLHGTRGHRPRVRQGRLDAQEPRAPDAQYRQPGVSRPGGATTDKPADSDWAFGYPPNGKGYEGATAAAIAAALGFTPDETDWIPNTVFENAFAPGPKPFDFHLAQISIRPERAEAVDFSDSYFDSHQAILALTYPVGAAPDPSAGPAAASGLPTNPILAVTTIEGLKPFKLGAAVGTTSFALIEDVIQPASEGPSSMTTPPRCRHSRTARSTASSSMSRPPSTCVMRSSRTSTPSCPEATIVGQFDELAQENQMGIVLEKGTP